MGMFDTIYCHYPLPDPEVQERAFQTKDLESLMETYTVTRAGRLVRHVEVLERSSSVETPWGFVLEVVDSWDEDTHFHGEIEIYTDAEGVFYSYVVRFTDGQLERLTRSGEGVRQSPNLARSPEAERYAHVFREAVRVFGDAKGARGWLWQPNTELYGATPLERVRENPGYEQVLELLRNAKRAKS